MTRIPVIRSTVRMLLVAVGAAMVLACAVPAFAATRSVPATRSVSTTVTIEGYDVDFTLPTNAKAGCQVCHGDPDLVRLKDGKLVSFWIDPLVTDASAHTTVQCTGCHLDFAFKTPHPTKGNDWQTEAKSSCQNCHLDQSALVARGSHRAGVLPGEKPDPKAPAKPLCGDCHGSHSIRQLTDSPEGKAALREQGWQVCGKCHEDYWDNYDDYYHGAAYKRGAKDAPACWDCHNAHDTLPSKDKDSSLNERHIVETCRACHKDANEDYVEYAKLIHRRDEIAEDFFLYRWISTARDAVMSLFGA